MSRGAIICAPFWNISVPKFGFLSIPCGTVDGERKARGCLKQMILKTIQGNGCLCPVKASRLLKRLIERLVTNVIKASRKTVTIIKVTGGYLYG